MKPFNTVLSFIKVEHGNMISIKLRETFNVRAPFACIQVAVFLYSQRILTVSQISKYQRVFENSVLFSLAKFASMLTEPLVGLVDDDLNWNIPYNSTVIKNSLYSLLWQDVS